MYLSAKVARTHSDCDGTNDRDCLVESSSTLLVQVLIKL